jgi:hypothetical protein
MSRKMRDFPAELQCRDRENRLCAGWRRLGWCRLTKNRAVWRWRAIFSKLDTLKPVKYYFDALK